MNTYTYTAVYASETVLYLWTEPTLEFYLSFIFAQLFAFPMLSGNLSEVFPDELPSIKHNNPGAPGWLHRLSVRLLVST